MGSFLNANAKRRIEQALAPLFIEIEQASRKRESEEAKKDPLKYKKTRVFDGSAGYHYWQTRDGLGRNVRFCYSTHRNAAGFFLGWRETWNKKGGGKRDKWISRRRKKRVVEIMQRRWQAHQNRLKVPQTAAGVTT